MIVALRAAVPQKSAVNTPALKAKQENTMNSRMEAILMTMTIALKAAALSTPRMTKNVIPHRTSDTTTTPTTAGFPVTGSENTPGMIVPRQ